MNQPIQADEDQVEVEISSPKNRGYCDDQNHLMLFRRANQYLPVKISSNLDKEERTSSAELGATYNKLCFIMFGRSLEILNIFVQLAN